MGQGPAALREVEGDVDVYGADEKKQHLVNLVQKLRHRNAPTYEEVQILLVLKEKEPLIKYLTDVFRLNEGHDERLPGWPANYEVRPFNRHDSLGNRIRPIFASHLLTEFQQGFRLEANRAEEPAVNVDGYDTEKKVGLLRAMRQSVELGNAPTWEQVQVLLAVDRATLERYITVVFELAENNHEIPPGWPEGYEFRPIRPSDTLYQHIRLIFTYDIGRIFQAGFQFQPREEAEGVPENVVQGIQNLGLEDEDERQVRAPGNDGPIAEEVNEGQAQGPANVPPN